MDKIIVSALKAIDVADLTRADWIAVGMALKEEGFPVSVWDEWSKNDSRYKPGECERLWNGFHGSSNPVRGGTIVKLAQERGWSPFKGEGGCLNWDDSISYDGREDSIQSIGAKENWNPAQDLIRYLETLFDSEDRVAYVTNDVWQNEEGKWAPGRGVWDRTAGQLIAGLKKHPNDVGATMGDWKSEAGAWIRFNPVDGAGVRNENVTRYRYALVESDTLPIEEQYRLYRRLELPIACLVHSGGKSLHAIVHVDAESADEYRRRVDYLYDFLEKNGVSIDRQNRNPSRLSRMPGVTRGGKRQYLVATNIGRRNWADWQDFAEGASDELPEMAPLAKFVENPPPLPEPLIEGILRRGHKMLISGSSKAGKSFLMMELCIAIAEGRRWLSFPCRKGRVLYINLEIDPASAINRFLKIYEALGIPPAHAEDIVIWNLRGRALPLDQLVPKLIRRIRNQHFDAIILDPIYKVITGDENKASDMGAFCNQFDRICSETGCSTIYSHHHSKGAQGAKKAMDRASGSGVFARDPDAQLDMVQLELTEHLKNNVRDGTATAWRLESSLREFPNIEPVDFWFEYPIHRVDESGALTSVYAEGSPMGNLTKSGKRNTQEDRKASVEMAYNVCSFELPVSLESMAEYMGVSVRCARDRIKECGNEYTIKGGYVVKAEKAGATEIGK